MNAQFGYIISPCDEKRYPNSLLGENASRTRQSYYASQDIAALHLPMTKCITVTVLNSEVAHRETLNILVEDKCASAFSALLNVANYNRVCAFTTNLITIHLECVFSLRTRASVNMLCLAYVPSCGLACLAVIVP